MFQAIFNMRESGHCGTIAACALALLLLPSVGRAEINQKIPLPEFRKESLLNGMEILFLPAQTSDCRFLLMLRNGAAFDPVGKEGATFLMTRMMMLASERSDPEQLKYQKEALQIEFGVEVDHDALFLSGGAPCAQIGQVVDLLAEIVTAPRLDDEVFELARTALLEERRREMERSDIRARELLHSEIFESNPYGRPAKGSLESLQALTVTDVKIQYRRLLMPNQAQLALYHSGDREALFRQVSRSWGRWVRKKPAPFTFRKAPQTIDSRILLIDSEAEVGLLCWGRLGVARNDSSYYALKVFEQYLLLSLPDWTRRVGASTQIQASPQVQAKRLPGYVQLSIQAPPSELIDYFGQLRATLKALGDGKIDEALLEESRQLALHDFKRDLQDPDRRLRRLLEMTLFEIGAGYIQTYGLRLARVTPQRFHQALAELATQGDFRMAVVGPSSKLGPQLKEIGDLRVINP